MKRLFVLLLASMFILGACAAPGAPAATPGAQPNVNVETEGNDNGQDTAPPETATNYRDVIRIGIDVDINMLDPRLSTGTGNQRVIEAIFDGLIDLDNNLNPIPVLALSWENPDPLTWIFYLREGVTFSNGQEFTALDVQHTFMSIIDPDFASPARGLFNWIDDIEIIDSHTVQFNLLFPFAPILSNMDRGIVPHNADEMEDFGMNPIGTGPYVLSYLSRGNRAVVEASPTFWGDAPRTRTIEYNIIPDNTTRTAALEAGDIDLIHSPLSPHDIERLRGDARFTVTEMSGLAKTFLNFNQVAESISDVRVRQAIAHMVDRDTIANSIYRGMDAPAQSGLLPGTWAYSSAVTNFPFNPARGQEILVEAGFEMGGDGFFHRDGQRLTVQLSTHTEDPNRIQALEFIQNVLIANGIDAQVTTNEWATFFGTVSGGTYEIALLGLTNVVDPDRYFYLRFRTGAANNEGSFSNARLDELVDEARRVADTATRAALYHEAAQIVNDYVAHHVLLHQGYIVMHTVNMQGFEPNSRGSFRGIQNVVIVD